MKLLGGHRDPHFVKLTVDCDEALISSPNNSFVSYAAEMVDSSDNGCKSAPTKTRCCRHGNATQTFDIEGKHPPLDELDGFPVLSSVETTPQPPFAFEVYQRCKSPLEGC